MLYFTLLRSELEYAFAALNSVRSTDSNKLEPIQRKFAALCRSRLFQVMECRYDSLLEKLNLLTLYNRLRHFGALFLINILFAPNVAPPFSKYSAVTFPLGTTVTLPCSLAVLSTHCFSPQMQFVN